MSKTLYPGANATIQYFVRKFTGSTMSPNVAILHTTEGFGWPGYSGGATAPNITGLPNIAKKIIEWRQHYPANKSSRALENRSGGVQTNTLNAFQFELVGTCDPRYAKRWGSKIAGVDYIYWPDAPDWALAELVKVLKWLHTEWPAFPLKDAAPRGWAAYPASYGLTAKQRLSFTEWLNCYGIVGHQHVPENAHGDPGAFPIKRLMEISGGAKPVEPKPPVVTPKPEEVARIVAMTYNVVAEVAHTGLEKFKIRVPHIVDFVTEAMPDLLFIEEMGDATTAKPLHDQLCDAGYVRLILGNWRAIYYRGATVTRNPGWRRGELTMHGAKVDGVEDTKATVYGLLKLKSNGTPFWTICTHLSHRNSEDAWRIKQADQIIALRRTLHAVKAAPVILGGDLNSSNAVVAHLVDNGFVDGRNAKSRISFEFNSLNKLKNPPLKNSDHVDHVLAFWGGGLIPTPARWEQFGNVKNGRYVLPFPADHNPVVVEWIFTKK
jgi:endonuclease/exonuclease/phosphatase family metal-dependent hydrolase